MNKNSITFNKKKSVAPFTRINSRPSFDKAPSDFVHSFRAHYGGFISKHPRQLIFNLCRLIAALGSLL